MGLNHARWGPVFRRTFAEQLNELVATLEQRLLPRFEGIEAEAEAKTDEAWDAFMSMPGTGDEDPSDFVDSAQAIGIEHYELLDGIRQGMINLFAVALRHLFEQQMMMFHREELLTRTESESASQFKEQVFVDRLARFGIHVAAIASWAALNELRLVANTVKHAAGDSASKLEAIRPDLFAGPAIRVVQPLVGHDIALTLGDIRRYRKAGIEFWREMATAISRI